MRVIRHEVIMKIKPEFIGRAAEVNEALAQITRYGKEIPEVIDISTSRAAYGESAMLIVVVEDEAALDRYNEHPAHDKMVQLANEISEDFFVSDYMVIKSRE